MLSRAMCLCLFLLSISSFSFEAGENVESWFDATSIIEGTSSSLLDAPKFFGGRPRWRLYENDRGVFALDTNGIEFLRKNVANCPKVEIFEILEAAGGYLCFSRGDRQELWFCKKHLDCSAIFSAKIISGFGVFEGVIYLAIREKKNTPITSIVKLEWDRGRFERRNILSGVEGNVHAILPIQEDRLLLLFPMGRAKLVDVASGALNNFFEGGVYWYSYVVNSIHLEEKIYLGVEYYVVEYDTRNGSYKYLVPSPPPGISWVE